MKTIITIECVAGHSQEVVVNELSVAWAFKCATCGTIYPKIGHIVSIREAA